MKRKNYSYILTSCLLFLHLFMNGQERTYEAKRLNGEMPVIDGILMETAWTAANWGGEFIQTEPYDSAAPMFQTTFAVLYDDDNLYVAIRAYDSDPSKIERRLSRRDNMDGDILFFSVDSYFDKATAFEFGVAAAGTKIDMRVSSDTDDDESWDPVWYVKTSVDSLGWLAEMRIPYSQIRFADVAEHTWGMQVSRWNFRAGEFSMWNFISRKAGVWVSGFGTLTGIRNIEPKREVELMPYAMVNLDSHREEEGNPYAPGVEFGWMAGLDGKIAVTNDITLNLTVNPDFGQVEADPSEVNLSAFETFFQEKRPFFIEGNNIFNYPLGRGGGEMSRDNLFYSRRIGRYPHYMPETADSQYVDMPDATRILGALKLSGKTRKGWSIGVMESLTNKETARIYEEGAEEKETVEPMTNYINTRFQKDFNQGITSVGGIFTATNRFINDSTLEFLPVSAYSGGFDYLRYFRNRTISLSFKEVVSYVSGSEQAILELQTAPQRFYQRPDASHLSIDSSLTSLTGHGGTLDFAKFGGGRWHYGGWVTYRSPGLELNDIGYLRQADNIQEVLWMEYLIVDPFSIFNRFYAGINEYTGWDFSGRLIDFGIEASTSMQFKNYWSFSSGIDRDIVSINRAELRGGPALRYGGDWNFNLNATTDDRKKLIFAVGGFFNWGDFGQSRFSNLGMEVVWKPINALSFSLEPEFTIGYRTAQYVETLKYYEDERYIVSRIDQNSFVTNLRINYSITPDMSIQFWGQPFFFAGDYNEFRRVTDPAADYYWDQFHTFNDQEISYNDVDALYNVDEDLDGDVDYTINDPDFKVFEFRSNLVYRWEYIPGSTLYVVWSQGRAGFDSMGSLAIRDDVQDLFSIYPHDVFLVKLSYRLSM